jgi:hypothetical protein
VTRFDPPAARRRGGLWLAAGVFVVSLGLLLFRFAFPRPIGFSDNGDGWRVLCQLHADAFGGPNEQPFVQFLYPASNNCSGVDYVTTQLWFGRIAQLVGHVVGPHTGLNLSVLAAVSSAFAAAALALIVLGLPVSFRWRIAAAVLVLLVVADSAFFGLFASADTEGASFLGVLFTAGGLLLLSRPGWWRIAGLVITVFGGTVLVNAKAQTVTILPLLLVALVFVPKSGRTWLARWSAPLVAIVAVTGLTGYLQFSMAVATPGADTRTINCYHAVFDNIVDGHHDTAADLTALGLPTSWSKYVGTMYWSPNTAVNDPRWPEYRDKFTATNLAHYYEQHPVRTAQILNKAGRDLLTLRPDYTGSFAVNAGYPPATKEWRVPVVSGLFRLVQPAGGYFLVPLWLLIALAALRAVRRKTGHRALGIVVLLLLGVVASQFLESALAEGIEGVKHQIIAAFTTALALMLAIVSLARRVPFPGEEPPAEPGDQEEPEAAEPVDTDRPTEILRA